MVINLDNESSHRVNAVSHLYLPVTDLFSRTRAVLTVHGRHESTCSDSAFDLAVTGVTLSCPMRFTRG